MCLARELTLCNLLLTLFSVNQKGYLLPFCVLQHKMFSFPCLQLNYLDLGLPGSQLACRKKRVLPPNLEPVVFLFGGALPSARGWLSKVPTFPRECIDPDLTRRFSLPL